MKTIYKKQCHGFTAVSHAVVFKSNLSVSAIGIMAKLLSNDENFIVHKEQVQAQSGLGVKAFNNAWNELVGKGFIKATRKHVGHIVWQYTIINEPAYQNVEGAVKKPQKSSTTKVGVEEKRLKGITTKGANNIDIRNKNKKNKNKIIQIEEDTQIPYPENVEHDITYGFSDNNFQEIEDEISFDGKSSSSIVSEPAFEQVPIELTNAIKINDDEVCTIINSPSTALEPASRQVPAEVSEKPNSTIQEEVKKLIREYVIKNKILPSIVKEDIDWYYSLTDFTENKKGRSKEELFNQALMLTSLKDYHGTGNPNSIQNRILKEAQRLIEDNNLDPDEANRRIDDYLELHKDSFYKISQNGDLKERFNLFAMYTKLRSTPKVSTTQLSRLSSVEQ